MNCATEHSLIEVKKSISSVKEIQFEKYINLSYEKYMNIKNKQVILYIDEPIDYNSIKAVEKIDVIKSKGVIVINNLEELKGVLK